MKGRPSAAETNIACRSLRGSKMRQSSRVHVLLARDGRQKVAGMSQGFSTFLIKREVGRDDVANETVLACSLIPLQESRGRPFLIRSSIRGAQRLQSELYKNIAKGTEI
nr:hypothetical protein CFP56_46730 [Quercus suber]